MNSKHPTPKVHPAYQALYGQPQETDAFNAAHARFKKTPEQQRQYIKDNLHLLNDQDLMELLNAMRASAKGDKGAIKRLVKKKENEVKELERQLLSGKSLNDFQQAVISDIENGGDK